MLVETGVLSRSACLCLSNSRRWSSKGRIATIVSCHTRGWSIASVIWCHTIAIAASRVGSSSIVGVANCLLVSVLIITRFFSTVSVDGISLVVPSGNVTVTSITTILVAVGELPKRLTLAFRLR